MFCHIDLEIYDNYDVRDNKLAFISFQLFPLLFVFFLNKTIYGLFIYRGLRHFPAARNKMTFITSWRGGILLSNYMYMKGLLSFTSLSC